MTKKVPKQFSYSRLCDNIKSLNYDNAKTLTQALEKYKGYLPQNRVNGFQELLEPKSRYNRKQINFNTQIEKFYIVIQREKLKFKYSKDQKYFESILLQKTFENLGD